MVMGESQLWKLAVAEPTRFKIPVADPTAEQMGMIVMLKANLPPAPARAGGAGVASAPTGPANVQLALRLKVQNRQITEAEHVSARIDAPAQIAALQTPRPLRHDGAAGRADAKELNVPRCQRLLRLARAW